MKVRQFIDLSKIDSKWMVVSCLVVFFILRLFNPAKTAFYIFYFVLLTVGLFYLIAILRKVDWNITNKSLVWLVLILVFSIYLRSINIAIPDSTTTEWAFKGMAKMFVEGNVYTIEQQPWTFVSYLAFFILSFGTSKLAMVYSNILLSSLTIIVVFYAGKYIFNEKTGLIAALMFAAMKQHIYYSSTAENNIMATLFIALIILFLATKQSNENFALLFGLAINVRYELAIYLIPALIIMGLPKTARPYVILALFIIPSLLIVSNNRPVNYMLAGLIPGYEYTGADHEISQDYSFSNSFHNFVYYHFQIGKHSWIMYILTLASLLFLDKRLKIPGYMLITYLAVYSIIIYGQHFRYMMFMYPMLVLIMAYSVEKITQKIALKVKLNKQILTFIILFAFLITGLDASNLSPQKLIQGEAYYLPDLNSIIPDDSTVSCCFFMTCVFDLDNEVVNYWQMNGDGYFIQPAAFSEHCQSARENLIFRGFNMEILFKSPVHDVYLVTR